MIDTLNIALRYLENGYTPLYVPLGSKAAKTPKWSTLQQTRERIHRDFSRPCNIGIRLGDRLDDGTTLIGIDVDLDDAPLLRVVERALGVTVSVKKGAKGATFLVRTDHPQRTRGINLRRRGGKTHAIDVLATGSQTIMPPSIHSKTGEPYHWVSGPALHELPIMDVPYVSPWVLAEIEGYCHDPADKVVALNDMEWCGVGGGGNTHETCHVAVASMVARKFPDEYILKRVERAKREACETAGAAYDWSDAEKVIGEWISSSHAKKFGTYSEDLVRSHGIYAEAYLAKGSLEFRYDRRRNCWYVFSDTHWKRDQDHVVRHSVEQFLPPNLRNRGFVEGVVRSLQDRPECAAPVWDADPSLLATPGGTVELRNGTMRDPRAEDYISRCTSVAPDFDKEPSIWLRCQMDWHGDEKVELDYHQKLAGLFLSGETNDHILPLWIGFGGNGKSKTTDTCKRILADYAGTAMETTFKDTRFSQHPEELAMLEGLRLVLCAELDGGWNESRIKQVTGGEEISAAFKYGPNFTYRPVTKLLATSNGEPRLKTVNKAMERRFHVCRFDRDIKDPDLQLGEKLKAEDGAILAWMIRGAQSYYDEGLKRSPAVIATTRDYLHSMNFIAQFVDDCCELGPDPHYRVAQRELYDLYRNYLIAKGRRAIPDMEAVPATLREMGIEKMRKVVVKGGQPVHAYLGIRILPSAREEFSGVIMGDF